MKASDIQDDLCPGIVARREAGRRTARAPTAAHALELLGQVKDRIARGAVNRDPCRAGGDHRWRAVEKPPAERGTWPPGPWEQCEGCGLYCRPRTRS